MLNMFIVTHLYWQINRHASISFHNMQTLLHYMYWQNVSCWHFISAVRIASASILNHEQGLDVYSDAVWRAPMISTAAEIM